MSFFKINKLLELSEKVIRSHSIEIKSVNFTSDDLFFLKNASPPGMFEEASLTLDFHCQCRDNEIDDGRKYWKYIKNNQIMAIGGIHARVWDPDDVCWGGWFIADPALSAAFKMGLLFHVLWHLINNTEYNKLYIEVFADQTQSNVYNIYKKIGLIEKTILENYYGDGQHLALMFLDLKKLRNYINNNQKNKYNECKSYIY